MWWPDPSTKEVHRQPYIGPITASPNPIFTHQAQKKKREKKNLPKKKKKKPNPKNLNLKQNRKLESPK